MALQVWLPLTKDLRNQGLSNVIVTNNGAIFNSAGKLGGTYSATASGRTITIDFANLSTMLANGKTYTLTCWVKPTGTPSNGWVIKLGNNNCGLWWAKSEARWVWNENDDGKRCANPTISADYTNWHHLAIVVDKTSSGKITTRQYVDGTLANGYPGSTWDNSSHSQPAGTIITISPYVSQLNDIRLYDHCLSPMEVKELSKGLVLHYLLNRGGWGQENLLLNTNTPATWSQGVNSSNYAVHDCFKTQSPVPSLFSVDELITISFDWSTTATGGNFHVECGAVTPWVWGTVISSKGTRNSTSNYIDINASNQLGHVEITFKITSSQTGAADTLQWLRIRHDGADTANKTFTISNAKLERGSIATPWCPNSSDALATTIGLNGTTEYDCSGFCNNATNFTAFEWSSDTPKYSVSTIFDETVSADVSDIYDSTSRHKQLTIATWIKRTSDDANYHYYWNNSGVRLGIRTYNNVSNYYWISWTHATDSAYEDHGWVTTVMPKNVWVHVAWVFDSGVWKQYINGILNDTRNDSSSGTYVYGDVGTILGNSWIGNLSDFRIYATALSANDVKSLYQNSAYIDSSGNIYGAVHSEV